MSSNPVLTAISGYPLETSLPITFVKHAIQLHQLYIGHFEHEVSLWQ